MEWFSRDLVLILVSVILAVVLGVLVKFLGRYWRTNSSGAFLLGARARFFDQRPKLETLFFLTAAASGKPRGLRWKECQWSDLVEWVRDRVTGQLMALVGVTISFEAIEGGDMEGVEAVGNLRNATAVFYFDGDWRTAGRVIYNLNPSEAVEHFKTGYERVD